MTCASVLADFNVNSCRTYIYSIGYRILSDPFLNPITKQYNWGLASFISGWYRYRRKGVLVYASICKYGMYIMGCYRVYKNCVDNSSFNFDHVRLLWIKIKINSLRSNYFKYYKITNKNQIQHCYHTQHLSLFFY